MSSMVRLTTVLTLLAATCVATPGQCQTTAGYDGRDWDQAHAQLVISQPGPMAQAIERWKQLTSTDALSFTDYSSFLLAYPGFPSEEKLRTAAEKALDRAPAPADRVAAYFDKFPPLTNGDRAHQALAEAALRRPDARTTAILAWRGGQMSDASEAAILYLYSSSLTTADHDARMNALLWQGATDQAAREIAYVSPAQRNIFMERLALAQGSPPGSLGLPVTDAMVRDPGYIYNRVRQARLSGNLSGAVQLLATRPPAATPPLDPGKWISELLNAAQGADSRSAVRIAASVDDAFPPGTDISQKGFKLRDDYTSLMWLGGTTALWSLGDAAAAAPLFYRYGAAAQTPGTRSKGFYWAGRALASRSDTAGAARYFEMAAKYPEQFYGMLALERLGRPMPDLHGQPTAVPTAAERAAFMAKPITAAVREGARDADWPTTVRFFREIADQAQTESDRVLVAELARQIGRRDLGVILGEEARTDGSKGFDDIAYPLIPTPAGADWTMVHAISRQESQFAQNAVSYAGARGLMQLMPATAREQASKIGLAWDPSALIGDASYNLRLGDAFFARMMDYYGGSYPLAVAAYNAGPGNVNKWLRANGDPRNGGIDWVQWIERIPIYQTKAYVQHVLENAVVYETMNPSHARYHGANPLSFFLGKRTPG
jgi:soluble lytic murein transglycosylase